MGSALALSMFTALVDPRRAWAAAVVLVVFARFLKITVLVEVLRAVLLPHVDFEFACGPAALPAVIAVADAVKTL
jgi:hypothetical protein